MPHHSSRTESIWMPEVRIATELPPDRELQADVCVVGAGIAGLTSAFQLARQGKSVIVLDAGQAGCGETERTTAHLSNAIDDRYFEIERIHGQENAKLAAESHTMAIAFIEQAARSEHIACDFIRLDGYLFAPPGETSAVLEKELDAARRAGVPGVEMTARAPLPGFDTGPCLRFPRQGQFHPLKYLGGLASSFRAKGGRLFTSQRVNSVTGGSPAKVETEDGLTVTAQAIIVATNTPMNDRVVMHTKQAAYRTYAIALRIPRGAIPLGLYWDTLDPYHYVRLQHAERGADPLDSLIVGGEDHKTGQAEHSEERFARLESWARERFPKAGDVTFQWSGQVMETVDGLGFIGRNPADEDNVFIVTGDSGMGMTHGTIAGILLTDLILGRDNPWAALYSPSRKRLHALGEFARENLNVAVQYTDWVTGGDVKDVEQIMPGSGAVVRRGLKKLAVFRDDQGQLHGHSAVCPHLGCVVQWNQTERSWDCPCHGSRFDCHGEVLNGPTTKGLAPVDVAAGETAMAQVAVG